MAIRLAFRRTSESFTGFDWGEVNRVEHLAKHGIDFPIAADISWGHILKAVDRRRHNARPGQPPRSVALAFCPKLVSVPVVVYVKSHGVGRIISIRKANAEEAALFHA